MAETELERWILMLMTIALKQQQTTPERLRLMLDAAVEVTGRQQQQQPPPA